MESLEGLDDAARAQAQARVTQMHKDANRMRMKRELDERRAMRKGAMSKASAAKMKAKREKAKVKAQERLKKQEEDVARTDTLEDNILTSSWKGRALEHRAHLYVKQHVDWAWALMKQAVVQFPRERAVGQFQFVSPDKEHFDSTFISVMIVVIRGHVWGVATTDLGGIDEMIKDAPQHTLFCRPTERLDRLPGDPFFSHAFDKGKDMITLKDFNMKDVPFLHPPFWASDHIPSNIVEANALTTEEFNAAFPTVEARLELSRKSAKHVRKLFADAARARAQAEVEAKAVADVKKVKKKEGGSAEAAVASEDVTLEV